MKHHIKLFLCLLITTSQLSAFFCDMENSWQLGLRAATASTTGKLMFKNNGNGDSDTIRFGDISFQGGAFFEFARKNDCWSWGILADVNGDTFNKRVLSGVVAGNLAYSVSLKTPLHFGADVRSGYYLIQDGLWYVLLGVEGVQNVLQTTLQVNNHLSDSFGFPVPSCLQFKFTRANIRVGTGFEMRVCTHGTLKLEYRYVQNGKKCISFPNPMTRTTSNTSVRSNQQSFALMFGYEF
jgi:opacity protein-like surface antigen